MNVNKEIILLRRLLASALLFLSLRGVEGRILGLARTWKAGMSLCSMESLHSEDIHCLLPREAVGSSDSLVNAPLTFSLTTDSTFMSTTTTSTSSNTGLTTTSSASSTAVPPLSSPTTSTRSVPSFTPTTTSTSSSITLPVTTTSSSFTSSSSSDTLTSSSRSMTASSKSSSSPSSTSTQSISSSTPASSSTSSSTSVSSTSPSSTSVPVSTSGSGSTTTESQTVPSSSPSSTSPMTSTSITATQSHTTSSSSPSSTSPMTSTSMTATQSHTTSSSSSSPSSTPSATDTGSSSTPTPSHSSSSETQSMTGTSLSPTSPTSHTSSMIGTSSSGGLSTGMTFSMTRSLSSVSGSQTMSHSSSPGTISSPSQSSQPTQTFSTTIGTTSPPVTTGPFSATTSRSSAPSTGAGTGTGGSSAFSGHKTSTSGSISLGQTSSAPSSSSSGAGSIGTGSSSGLSRHSNHLSTILPILLPLLLLLLLLSAFYLCRRKQLRRGMNVFGQRLELGETPEAWWRLGDPGNTVTSNISHEAGSRTRDEEKQQYQRRGQNVDQTVPSSSEKRSVYAIAASIVGRVGVPAKPDNLSHGRDIDFSYLDEEKETLKDKFEGVTRTVGGPISTLAASVAKRKYLPMGKQNRSESGDRGQRPSEYASPPSSSSSPMPYPTPPSSRFSSRNHTPFPSLPFTFYRATNSSSRTDSISPVQDVPATASVTDTDITVSDQVSYIESLSHSRLDPDDFETEIQVSGQQGYIPIIRTGTRVLADSSSSSISGMEYIPFMSRDTDLDSYMQTAPRTPSTRSLDLTRTHTSQSTNSDMIVSSPPPPRCENASEISCISQNSHNTYHTGNSYGTQDTVETTSSLSFAQPKIIRTSASHGNDPVSKGETTEVPLVTSTFHYSPNPEDEDDIALGSSSRSSPGLASKNPFHPSNALFHPDPLYTSNQSYEKDVAVNSFIRTLEWRRRAMAHADNTGQGPSLMEAVEVYFAPSNSNTDSSPGSPA
ncbi:hypothetical protein F5050DRAFT_1898532 [Lentinula boryana]|uniref:Uncharacterized protein n=1 Tax=Lentinula boryana TaxID=40481 RepID=A0ABQ8Q103_9AGAR|nr:hypothetical protein F5050DRAFT_1898532 [Lentinula boryana]